MKTATEIRNEFIDFFVKKYGHVNVPSSSVVPHDDPTLLFANAGMNQFKPYFLGTEKPKATRVANTQKCIRAGGKHNDLDDVGRDTYHHTFFEMLGNWSFGDYFKTDAITWAWELLTEVWGLDKSRLHVTVFEGDADNGIPRDDEAADIWKSVGVPAAHIHLGNKKDNFWEMGETGPCGPCTEIHIDRTPDKSGGKLVNAGSEQCIEIWNNVFIQFNRNADKSLTPLPAKHVDTGMGFERICSVIQGKSSNYDTDVFTPLFAAIQQATGAPAYNGALDTYKTNNRDIAYRVIADHIRTLTIALTDGALPSNKGRGAVLRSILRRAFRFGYQQFGMRTPFLHSIVDSVVLSLGGAFPELQNDPAKVKQIIWGEEEDFLRTIDRGLSVFTKAIDFTNSFKIHAAQWSPKTLEIMPPIMDATWARHAKKGLRDFDINPPASGHDGSAFHSLQYSLDLLSKTGIQIGAEGMIRWHTLLNRVPGEVVFDLYTTYGFPPDLTRVMALEHGYEIDEERYKVLFKRHEDISRGDKPGPVVSAIKGDLPVTDDSPKYDNELCDATVLGWVIGSDVHRSGTLSVGETAALLLDKTNFYAEQGGQVGDTGTIDVPERDAVEFQVEDTQRLGDSVLHFGTILDGEIRVGDKVRCSQGTMRRVDIMRNHTATHLMNLILRQVLGQHVEQKGSLVDDDKTRFDFTHDKPIEGSQIREIERRVNSLISRDLTVTAITMPLAEAKKIEGVRAVFGEKYPDPVRVVLIGPETPQLAHHDDSVEFCGGTHVPRTGTIGYFKILSHEGVAKGIRRITAVTGRVALDRMQALSATIEDLTTRFVCKPEDLLARIEAMHDEVKGLKAAIAKSQAADLGGAVDKIISEAVEINGTKIVVGRLPGMPVEQYRTQIDRVRQIAKSAFIIFIAEDDGKVPVIVALTNDLITKGLKSGEIIKPLAEMLGGKGGGKPEMAQAGGKDASKIDAALALAKATAEKMLK
ncbi:hypothetical protein BH11PLA2_BH11PLA2_25880 [soil metagenome]